MPLSAQVTRAQSASKTRLKSAFAALLLVTVAGCAGDELPINHESPSYMLGKSDGCWSATTAVPGFPETMHRDQTAFDTDRDYNAGWIDGFGGCNGNQQWDDRSIFNERDSGRLW